MDPAAITVKRNWYNSNLIMTKGEMILMGRKPAATETPALVTASGTSEGAQKGWEERKADYVTLRDKAAKLGSTAKTRTERLYAANAHHRASLAAQDLADTAKTSEQIKLYAGAANHHFMQFQTYHRTRVERHDNHASGSPEAGLVQATMIHEYTRVDPRSGKMVTVASHNVNVPEHSIGAVNNLFRRSVTHAKMAENASNSNHADRAEYHETASDAYHASKIAVRHDVETKMHGAGYFHGGIVSQYKKGMEAHATAAEGHERAAGLAGTGTQEEKIHNTRAEIHRGHEQTYRELAGEHNNPVSASGLREPGLVLASEIPGYEDSFVRCVTGGATAAIDNNAPWEQDKMVDFMWMPAGVHNICAGYNKKRVHMAVECSQETANIVQASFEKMRKEEPKQIPFGCVEHREQEASVRATGFRFEPGTNGREAGVYIQATPTALGEKNVNGKIHCSWSPSFGTDADYEKAIVKGDDMFFPPGVRGSVTNPAKVTCVGFCCGTLTNRPAFREMAPVTATMEGAAVMLAPGLNVAPLLNYLSKLRVAHWNANTETNDHEAIGNLYTKVNELVDSFVEKYLGKNKGSAIMETGEQSPAMGFSELLNLGANVVTELRGKVTGNEDLLNILAEIEGEINQARFLLRATMEAGGELVQAAGTSEGLEKAWQTRHAFANQMSEKANVINNEAMESAGKIPQAGTGGTANEHQAQSNIHAKAVLAHNKAYEHHALAAAAASKLGLRNHRMEHANLADKHYVQRETHKSLEEIHHKFAIQKGYKGPLTASGSPEANLVRAAGNSEGTRKGWLKRKADAESASKLAYETSAKAKAGKTNHATAMAAHEAASLAHQHARAAVPNMEEWTKAKNRSNEHEDKWNEHREAAEKETQENYRLAKEEREKCEATGSPEAGLIKAENNSQINLDNQNNTDNVTPMKRTSEQILRGEAATVTETVQASGTSEGVRKAWESRHNNSIDIAGSHIKQANSHLKNASDKFESRNFREYHKAAAAAHFASASAHLSDDLSNHSSNHKHAAQQHMEAAMLAAGNFQNDENDRNPIREKHEEAFREHEKISESRP